MATITRTFIAQPSNSKAPGASRHLSFTTDDGGVQHRFELGSMDVPENATGTVRIACTFNVGQGRYARQERREASLHVRVTGRAEDVVRLGVRQSQSYEVEISGVVEAAP